MLTPIRLINRARALLSRRRLDEELDEELRFHLDMDVEQRVKLGMTEQEARASALQQFGNVLVHRDDARDAQGIRPLEDLAHDARTTARKITRRPSYFAVMLATLAVGIGGTTAFGSAVYRTLLAPYPFPEADRIVTLWRSDARAPGRPLEVAPGSFVDWKERARSFEFLAGAEPYSFDWARREGPERFQVTLVTDDFFPLQRLRPLLGRYFTADDFQRGRDNVVMLTETTWRNRFGADSAIVGRTLVLDMVPRTVVGVMPKEALAPYDPEMWAPKVLSPPERENRIGGFWTVVGRLAPGVTFAQAQAEMTAVARRLAAEYPAANRNDGVRLLTLREASTSEVRTPLLLLFGAVGFVLLIACVNVANLQFAEAVRRERELAIQTAIGAGRGRLIRQLLTENLVVAVVGGGLGLVLAYVGIGSIRASAPAELWPLQRLELDAAALGLAALLAMLCAGVIAVMPIVAMTRLRLAEALAAGGRGGATWSSRRGNRVLVVSEMALALALLVGAGLMLRTLAQLHGTDRGFSSDGVLVTTLHAWRYYPTPAARAEFVRQAEERLKAIPGVDEVGTTTSLPLDPPIGPQRVRVRFENQAAVPTEELPEIRAAAVSPSYFRVLRIPVEEGRGFLATDDAESVPVAIVSRSFARRYFGDENPLGKRITCTGFLRGPTERHIVGVVGDVRQDGLHAEPVPVVFMPHAQAPTGGLHVVLRSSGDPAMLERPVRQALASMNASMPLSKVATMNAIVRTSLQARRFQLGLLAAFAAAALVLTAVGIYGVMTRVTQERTHEIGVRMAVGATAADVVRMVLAEASALAVIGILAGTLIAVALSRYMVGLLFGVTSLDPPTYAGAAGVLLAVAVVSTWLPARRAATVDPVRALRND